MCTVSGFGFRVSGFGYSGFVLHYPGAGAEAGPIEDQGWEFRIFGISDFGFSGFGLRSYPGARGEAVSVEDRRDVAEQVVAWYGVSDLGNLGFSGVGNLAPRTRCSRNPHPCARTPYPETPISERSHPNEYL